MEQPGEEIRRHAEAMTLARPNWAGVIGCVSGGLPFYPRVEIAFLPSQVSSYPVGGEFPFPPFVADGAFGDSEYCGDVAR